MHQQDILSFNNMQKMDGSLAKSPIFRIINIEFHLIQHCQHQVSSQIVKETYLTSSHLEYINRHNLTIWMKIEIWHTYNQSMWFKFIVGINTLYDAFLVLIAWFSLKIGTTLSCRKEPTISLNYFLNSESLNSLSVTRSLDDTTSRCMIARHTLICVMYWNKFTFLFIS